MATCDSLRQISKAKVKMLNRKAKSQRVEAALSQERQLKVSAEATAKHWRHKACLYKRLVLEIITESWLFTQN